MSVDGQLNTKALDSRCIGMKKLSSQAEEETELCDNGHQTPRYCVTWSFETDIKPNRR